ncbi:MAG: hypothetical protein ACK5BE_06615 [Alphaproteobacteria bacterium]
MRLKLGFSKENIIPWLIQGLIIFVFVYTILFWREVDKVQASMSIATLLTVLFLGKQLKVQNEQLKIQGDEFKKSLDIQEKRDKENEKKGLKDEMEAKLLEIVISFQDDTQKKECMYIFDNRKLFLNKCISDYFADNILATVKHDYKILKEGSLKDTGEVHKRKFELLENNLVRYFEQNEKLKKEFGEDEYHSKIAKILKDKLSFLKNA